MNIDELKKVVSDVCQALNAVSKFINKQGIFSLYPLIAVSQDLVLVNWTVVKGELLKLDATGKAELDAVIKANLNLVNAASQAKLIQAVDCVEQAVGLVEEGVGLFNQGKGLVDRVKSIIGA